jgi:lysophospholipase L1-like esterase
MKKRRHGGGTAAAVIIVMLVAAVAGVLIAGLPRHSNQLVIRDAPATTESTDTSAVPTTAPPPDTTPDTTDAPETTEPADTTVTSQAPRPLRVSVLGDSWSLRPTPTWAEVAGELLADDGIDAEFTVDALELTGYTIGADARTTFVDRAADIDPTADVVVVFGGFDDRDGPVSAIELAALATLTTVRDIAPDATIVVVGAPWGNAEAPDTIRAVNEVLAEQASAADATFVDPVADGWFADGDVDLIGPDLLHPSESGQALIADRLVEVIRSVI